MWTNAACVVLLLLTAVTGANANSSGPVPIDQQLHSPDSNTPLPWFMLKNFNVGPLLVPLSHQMRPLLAPSHRHEAPWIGEDAGTRLKLHIADDGKSSGEVFVGFFSDATWSSPPLQIRVFPRAGDYEVTDLPARDYVIGAMIGTEPVHIALGVGETWPEPVTIKRDRGAESRILLSKAFDAGLSIYNTEIAKGYGGAWDRVNPQTLLQGQVRHADGTPVPFALIQIREYKPGARSIRAPDTGTNREGKFYYDQIDWPYTIYTNVHEVRPRCFGYQHQMKKYPEVLRGAQTADFVFGDFPKGNASVHGSVHDQNGRPVDGFFVQMFQITDDHESLPDSVGFRFPFMRPDGTFDVSELPAGQFRFRVTPFDQRGYEWSDMLTSTLGDATKGQLTWTVTAKARYFGKLDFGSEALPEARDGKLGSINLGARGDGMSFGVADVDATGTFGVYLSDKEIDAIKSGKSRMHISGLPDDKGVMQTLGEVSIDALSTDERHPGGVKAHLAKASNEEEEPAPRTSGLSIDLDVLNLVATSGELVKVADLNAKVVLVNVFATWCGPCNEELPELKKLSEEFSDKGLRVIAISRKEEAAVVEEFVKSKEIPYKVLLDPDGKGTQQFSEDGKSVAVPTNMLLDSKLHPVFLDIGYAPQRFENLRKTIADLLK